MSGRMPLPTKSIEPTRRKRKRDGIGNDADDSERNAHRCPRNEESNGIGLRDERGVFSLNAATGSAALKEGIWEGN
jgi:hypothetical protein